MKLFLYGGVTAMILVLVGSPVYAATLEKDENTTIEDPVKDDVYAFSQRIVVGAPISQDFMGFGSSVSIESPIGGDVITAGESVSISNSVGDDVFVAGSTVSIETNVAGDVFAAGQNVSIEKNADVNGDLFAAGASVVISGTVHGNVRAAGNVIVPEGATIDGNLVVVSDKEPVISENATVAGEVKHIIPDRKEHRNPVGFALSGWITGIIMQFVIAFLLALSFPAIAKKLQQTIADSPVKRIGIGFAWVVLVIPAAILLAITVIGIPLAVLLVAVTVAACVVAHGVAALFTGSWLMKKLSKDSSETTSMWVVALLGATAFQTLHIIPILGWIAAALILLAALGSIFAHIIPAKK